MKKLILIVAILVVATSTFAQKGTGVKLPLAIGDTLGRNTGATQVNKFISLTGGYNGAVIQVVLTSQSGTPAGSVHLEMTTDGVTYDKLVPASTADSLILGATATHYTWRIAGPLPPKIKIHATNTGTQNSVVSVWYKTPIFQTQ